MRTHPHADAAYSVIPLKEGGFAVEVLIPDTYPTKVSPFANEAAAEAWIAQHKLHVQEGVRQRRAPPPRPA
jgi:hypothetical protein